MRAVLERYLTLVVVGVIVLLVAGVTWSRGGQTVMRDFVAAQLDVARLHAALADDDPLVAFQPPKEAPEPLFATQRQLLIDQTGEQRAKLAAVDRQRAQREAEQATYAVIG